MISEEIREGMKEVGWEERSKVVISDQVKLHPHLTGAGDSGMGQQIFRHLNLNVSHCRIATQRALISLAPPDLCRGLQRESGAGLQKQSTKHLQEGSQKEQKG